MKPPPFDYERPADTDAALASLFVQWCISDMR
jgi:hypothetical protein